jgi:hypothetical protein
MITKLEKLKSMRNARDRRRSKQGGSSSGWDADVHSAILNILYAPTPQQYGQGSRPTDLWLEAEIGRLEKEQ